MRSLTALVQANQVLPPDSLRIPLGCAQKRQALGGNPHPELSTQNSVCSQFWGYSVQHSLLGNEFYLSPSHCCMTEKIRLPFTGPSLQCVVPGQQQQDFPNFTYYTPRIPTTANELPKGAGHTLSHDEIPPVKSFQKGDSAWRASCSPGQAVLGDTHSKSHRQIKHPVKVRNIKARCQYPAYGVQTASPAWWLGEKWLFGVHGNPTLSHEEKDVAAFIHDQGLVILKSG